MTGKVVIVGAGHGGGGMATALRQAGHAGEIVLIGDEPRTPYQRPPLSKAYLKGAASADSLKLRPDEYYAKNDIRLVLGRTAIAVNAAARRVTLDDGTSEDYDILVLATGSRARRLAIPGADHAAVHHLRDIADADRIRDAIGPGKRLAVVGGGYVGLEAAASARGLGAEVVLIEREARILARVACVPLADFYDRSHRAHGVEIIVSARVAAFEADGERLAGVRLGDGRLVACDAVLVGVGGVVSDQLARDAGLACEDGVVVDENARTADACIYAIGDMTRRPMPLYGGRMFRLESVPNAAEQARRAACDIMGKPQAPHEVPWFWSDQYDLKLQIAGVPFDSHRLVVRGDVAGGRFAIWHLAEAGHVLAVEAVNAASEFMAGKTLVASRRVIAEARLADSAVPIKAVLAGG